MKDSQNMLIRLIFIITVILFSVFAFWMMMSNDLNGEVVDCYDKYSNKIEGEICIVEGSFDSEESRLLASILIMVMVFSFAYLFYLFDKSIKRFRGPF